MATTAEKIAKLENIRNTGLLRTTVDGVEVAFKSDADLRAALADLYALQASEAGSTRLRQVRFGISRGVA